LAFAAIPILATVQTLKAKDAVGDFSSILVAQNGVPMPGIRAGKPKARG